MKKTVKAVSAMLTLAMLFCGMCTYARDIDSVMAGATDYSAWKDEAPASAAMPTPEPTPSTNFREVEIGRATTTYGMYAAQANRNRNMELAAKAIDYTVLNSGERFSFNGVVGPRTAERGYKEATVFVGQEKVPGLGGGICQISSTVYMAVKNAGLSVVERHQHSMPVTYCSRDDEATVSWGYLDFKFRNNRSNPIRIESSCSGGVVRVVIYERIPR